MMFLYSSLGKPILTSNLGQPHLVFDLVYTEMLIIVHRPDDKDNYNVSQRSQIKCLDDEGSFYAYNPISIKLIFRHVPVISDTSFWCYKLDALIIKCLKKYCFPYNE